MSDFRIDFPELPGFVTALRGAPKVLQTELMAAAKRISFQGESISKAAAPVNTGNLRSSVYSKTTGGASQVSAIFGASAEYAIYVDRGRGPGKMPPQGALLGWGGVTEENEFVVRRAIGRRGIKPRPFVTKAFDQLKGGIALKEFSAAIQKALAKIGGG